MIVLGLMSGTSFDSVDAAAAELSLSGPELVLTPLGMVSRPYPAELRAGLLDVLPPGRTTAEQICRLDSEIGQAFAETAAAANQELSGGRAELVVSHGQTVYHWAESGRVRGTLQLGQPAWIAERTGLPVVADLRARDVAAGGQGAPLVSAFDLLWLQGRAGRPVAVNLGGIANLTVVPADEAPMAFDTGPANALLDAVVARSTDGSLTFDRDGRLAAAGSVEATLLGRLLDHPYFDRPAPKSTGKELFNLDYVARAQRDLEPVDTEDLMATLVEFSAVTVADAVRSVGGSEVIASGGGVRNPVLLARLADRLADVGLRVSDELGIPAEAKEAYAFAVLGFLTVHGLPSAIPSCTGARRASVLGAVIPGADGRPALPWSARTPPAAPTRLRIEPVPSVAG